MKINSLAFPGNVTVQCSSGTLQTSDAMIREGDKGGLAVSAVGYIFSQKNAVNR